MNKKSQLLLTGILITFFCLQSSDGKEGGRRIYLSTELPLATWSGRAPVTIGQRLPESSEEQQYTSAGHVLGFRKDGVVIASGSHALRVEFVSAQSVSPVDEGRPSGLEKGQSRATELRKVTYPNLWDGVTVVYEGTESGVVKSTYHILPGEGKTSQALDEIRLRYSVPVKLDCNGDLVFSFAAGEMQETRPVAWQEVAGKKRAVEAGYRLLGEREVGYKVGEYDPRYPLVIDPVLIWNTFLGGTDGDSGEDIAVDLDGNIYVVGTSNATWGSPARPFYGGQDAFVAKMDANGNLMWNTFLGALSIDRGQGIALDANGGVYVIGHSYTSWGSPVLPFNGFGYDAFVAKLDGDGNLQWNTFLGSGQHDEGYAIAVDASGDLFITGYSSLAWGSPVSPPLIGQNMFIAKLNGNGNLLWNNFFGGGTSTSERIAVDGQGNTYITGESMSTWGAPIRSYSSPYYDAFVAKFDRDGNFLWNTFLGQQGYDYGTGIACDTNGNIYATGSSAGSWGSPVRAKTLSGFDAFVVALDGSGNIEWNTFLGANGVEDRGEDIALDTVGNVFVTGYSFASWGSPIMPFSGQGDIFSAKLSGSGNLQWNAFLGGQGDEFGYAIAVDQQGNLYTTGLGRATWGSPVRAHDGLGDAFVTKVGSPSWVEIKSPSNGAIVNGIVSIQVDAYDQSGISKVEFYLDGVLTATDTTYPYSYAWNTSGLSGTHTIKAIACHLASQFSEAQISIIISNPLPPTITVHPQSQTINSGQTALLAVEATGYAPLSYQWHLGATGNTLNPIDGAILSTYTTPALTSTSSYWVCVTNAYGPALSNTAVVTIGVPSKLMGTVLDQATVIGIPGANVALGAYPQVSTDASGHYEIPNLSSGDFPLVITKPGYNTYSGTVGISVSGTIIREFSLTAAGSGGISIDSLTSKYGGFVYYLEGVDFVVTYTAHVNWGGHSPGKVRFITSNGQYDVTATGDTVSRDFNIATDFGPCTTLEAVATSSDGSQSDIKKADFSVMPYPLSIGAGLLLRPFYRNSDFFYKAIWNEFKPIEAALGADKIPTDIPFFGGKGFNLDTLLAVDLDAKSSGKFDITLNLTEKPLIKGKMAGFDFELTPTLNLSGQYSYSECAYRWDGYLGLNGKVHTEVASPPFFVPVGPFVIPMYLKSVFDFSADASLGVLGTDPIKWSGDLTLNPSVRGSVGAGFNRLFAVEGWVEGEAVFNLHFPDDPALKTLTLSINVGVSAVAFGKDWSPEIYGWNWTLIDNEAQVVSPIQIVPVSPKPLSRAYLSRPNAGRFFAGHGIKLSSAATTSRFPKISAAILQESVYPYSDPCLSYSGGLLGMAWLQDDAERLAINRTKAIFSTYDGAAWSTPLELGDDGTADFHPQHLMLEGGDSVAVWEDVKTVLSDTATFDDIIANLEISASTYDASTGTWQSFQRITDNGYLDGSPMISGTSLSNVMLTWISNEANDLMGSASAPNKLWYSIFNGTTWSTPQQAGEVPAGILKYSFIYNGAIAHIVFSLDMDGDQSTVADNELYRLTYSGGTWGTLTRFTDDSLPDVNPKLAFVPTGHIVLVWMRGNQLSCSVDFYAPVVIYTDEFSTNLADFKLASSATGKLAILWSKPAEYNSDLNVIFYDPAYQTWCASPHQITSDPEVERNLAVAFYGESDLVAAYDRTPVVTTAVTRKAANGKMVTLDIPQPGVTDLYVLQYTMGRDLALSPLSLQAYPVNPEPGAGVTLTATAANTGDETAFGVPVAFYLGDPSAGGTLIDEVIIASILKPGDMADVSLLWEVPDTNVPLTIYAVVDPAASFDTEYRDNNTISIQIVKPDLEINGVRWDWLGADKVSVTARVVNAGVIPSGATTIKFRRDSATGTLLSDIVLPSLTKDEFRDVTYEWDVTGLGLMEYPIHLSLDEENVVPEFNEANNTKLITVTPTVLADSIIVMSPNGGESWPAGSLQKIQWATSGIVGDVMIEYSTDDGYSFAPIIASTPNTGSYDWTVLVTPSSTCWVRISEAADGNPSDRSDRAFSITAQNGGLQVTLGPPNAVGAGAQWRIDGGEWQNSGTTVSGLPPGSHTVNYASISGWTTPTSEAVDIIGGATFQLNATYQPDWQALGSGTNGVVLAILPVGNDVYVGGVFSTAGDIPSNNIAKWDGTSWSALGSGVNAEVDALAFMGGNLYAGGTFTTAGNSPASCIAKWDGSTWSPLGSGISPWVASLCASGSNLYVGGGFTSAGEVPANCIARWDGNNWSALGSGMNNVVLALEMMDGILYAGGGFTTADDKPAESIAKWDGLEWSAAGTGMEGGWVRSLGRYGNSLVAGGGFTIAGGINANHIAKWDGSVWTALGDGTTNAVWALKSVGSDLYAGGYFTQAGSGVANHIAKWDGFTWSPLGIGTDLVCKALGATATHLYVGGDFIQAGFASANHIARWSLESPEERRVDFNDDGLEDILWRYYASGGYNRAWFLDNHEGTILSPQPVDASRAGSSRRRGTREKVTKHALTDPRDAGLVSSQNERADFLGIRDPMREHFRSAMVDDPRRAGRGESKPSRLCIADPRQVKSAFAKERPSGTLVETASLPIFLGGADILPVDDPAWKVVGTGDFNNDTCIDILWRNSSSGSNVVWFMNGAEWAGSAELLLVSDQTWQVVGTGDFNKDAHVDILWRNSASGENVVWYMYGTEWIGSAVLLGVSDLTWEIVGTGDFNKDGNVDILWRNSVAGWNVVWHMDGVNWDSSAELIQVDDMTWQIAGTGDYNKDGNVDILWRYNGPGGSNVIWYMNGASWAESAELLSVPDLNWKVVSR